MLRAKPILFRCIAQVSKQHHSSKHYISISKFCNGQTKKQFRYRSTSGESIVKVTETSMSEIEKDRLKNASSSVESVEKIQTPKGCTLTPEELEEEDDEMEQEDMFIEPHEMLGTNKLEWGGPRRGGRLAEPTRFGDWERKGRCTDF